MKYILQLIVLLFLISSCYDKDRHYSTKEEQQIFNSEIAFNTYNLKPNELESKMGKEITYVFPMINGDSVDVHLRIEKNEDNCCAIFFYQGNPMKVDHDYQRLLKQEKVKQNNTHTIFHKTTYNEQIDILHFMTYICESKMGIKDFAYLIFGFEDLGEMSVDITELCDSINTNKSDKSKNVFSDAMAKTTLAKDLRNIFKRYDVEFINYTWYYKKSKPYDLYASQHKLFKEHNTPHVYIIDGFIVRLNKKKLK